MPALSTHFRLAALVIPSLDIVSQVGFFLLGVTAPDAFVPDDEDSFSQHHFKGADGRISLQTFLKITDFALPPRDNPAWSFTCGYFSHLWLDVFYRENADHLPHQRPADMSEADLRSVLRRETESVNAPFVLRFDNLPMPESGDLSLPPGLEFVNLDRCTHLFREVLAQSRAWRQAPTPLVVLDEADYAAFLASASKSFVDKIRAMA